MILLAPDKFKGSLSAQQVCAAVREALLRLNVDLDVVSHPMADGGEGTADLLTQYSGGSSVRVKVLDPLFREIESVYGISADGSTAFIEMAKASGLQLLKTAERNPLITTTMGTGQLIADALDRNVMRIILGVGGSATNDGGMGMAQALGYRFLDRDNKELKPVGGNLSQVAWIEGWHPHDRLRECELTAIYDVGNPLHGQRGAAFVYARQKGADDAAIELLDRGLLHFAGVIKKQFKVDVNFEGAGAGGGLPAMATLLFRAHFEPGIDFIIRFTKLEQLVERANVVITGEGKIDEQTMTGKVVKGVSQLCLKHHKDCIGIAGKCELPPERQNELGLKAIITLADDRHTEKQAMDNAYGLLVKKMTQSLPGLIPGL